jgi:LPXTG-motif cell wall-anchored protein
VTRPLALLAAVSASIVLFVAPPSLLAMAQTPTKPGEPGASSEPSVPSSHQKDGQPAQAAQEATTTTSQAQPETPRPELRPVARAAGSGSVQIHDFAFAPKSLTVQVGDRVSWFNQGPSGHSATADDGSFDTGVLSKGASGSFTFKTPGTFSYHCTPHPFMKASITVRAAGGGSQGGSTSGGTTSKSGAGSGSSQGTGSTHPVLPSTGLDIAAVAGLGLLMLGLGALVRRRIAADS